MRGVARITVFATGTDACGAYIASEDRPLPEDRLLSNPSFGTPYFQRPTFDRDGIIDLVGHLRVPGGIRSQRYGDSIFGLCSCVKKAKLTGGLAVALHAKIITEDGLLVGSKSGQQVSPVSGAKGPLVVAYVPLRNGWTGGMPISHQKLI